MVKEYTRFNDYPCCIYYRDDDNDLGYGDNAQVCYWFGLKGMEPSIPNESEWENVSDIPEQPDEFDLACERRYD